jgi:hypothetical protein
LPERCGEIAGGARKARGKASGSVSAGTRPSLRASQDRSRENSPQWSACPVGGVGVRTLVHPAAASLSDVRSVWVGADGLFDVVKIDRT